MFRLRGCLACFVLTLAFTGIGSAGETVLIARGSSLTQPKQPQLVVDDAGIIHVAFGAAKAVYYSKSTDSGNTFADPIKVGEVAGLALGMRRGPRIVAGAKSAVITAIGHEDGNVLAWHATDDGRHWYGPVQVNDSSRDAREGLHSMARGPGGEIYCVWLDCRDQQRGSRIFGAGSTDGGKTWTKNRRVYSSPSGSVCECCHPSVAYDVSGKLHVMWRNSLQGARDMYMASSTDGGETFSAAVKLGSGTWRLDACPMDGGYLAVSSNGVVFTAWRRSSEVFLTSSADTVEKRLGAGTQPWIAATDRGPQVVWLEKRPGRLFLQGASATEPKQLATNANDPVIASGSGASGLVVAAWEERRGNDTTLVCRVIAEGK